VVAAPGSPAPGEEEVETKGLSLVWHLFPAQKKKKRLVVKKSKPFQKKDVLICRRLQFEFLPPFFFPFVLPVIPSLCMSLSGPDVSSQRLYMDPSKRAGNHDDVKEKR
jgi:hypothetical protein